MSRSGFGAGPALQHMHYRCLHASTSVPESLPGCLRGAWGISDGIVVGLPPSSLQ